MGITYVIGLQVLSSWSQRVSCVSRPCLYCSTLIHFPNRHFRGCLATTRVIEDSISPRVVFRPPPTPGWIPSVPKLPESRLESQIPFPCHPLSWPSSLEQHPRPRLVFQVVISELRPAHCHAKSPQSLSNRKSPFEKLRALLEFPSVRHPVSVLNLFTAFNISILINFFPDP